MMRRAWGVVRRKSGYVVSAYNNDGYVWQVQLFRHRYHATEALEQRRASGEKGLIVMRCEIKTLKDGK